MAKRLALPLLLAALVLAGCGKTMNERGSGGNSATPARATTVAPSGVPVLGTAAAGAAAGAGGGVPLDAHDGVSQKPIWEK